MEEKKTIILDLTGCETWGELHKRIRVAFDFPEWYGENWDAFWDLLRSECDADEVVIKGENTLNNQIYTEIKTMYNMLDMNVSEHEKYRKLYADVKPFTYRIED
ncbi:MAG: barstar family protein [Clostridia bacterium]|nr:barstar family protein [Clostridia bacterium]